MYFALKKVSQLSIGRLNRIMMMTIIENTDGFRGTGHKVQLKQKQMPVSFADTLKAKTAKVSLGVLDKNNPTVSDLLVENTAFKKDCWNIIHNKMNRDKAYREIYAQTEIFIDPATKELSWNNHAVIQKQSEKITQKRENIVISKTIDKNILPETGNSDQISGLFESAVKSVMGTDYDTLDCYELLIKGMEKLGVKYRGQGGLSSYLSSLAVSRGLPSNALKTGEGLIEVSGEKKYARVISSNRLKQLTGNDLLNDISGSLKPGDILSFSTRTRGHTGIVSQQNDQWTYVNSGILDNTTRQTGIKKGVGEQMLAREFSNWLSLAAKRNETLIISSGTLNGHKLSPFI